MSLWIVLYLSCICLIKLVVLHIKTTGYFKLLALSFIKGLFDQFYVYSKGGGNVVEVWLISYIVVPETVILLGIYI